MNPPTQNRFRTIDAARGVAALWVLAFHAFIYIELPLRAGLLGYAPPGFANGTPGESLTPATGGTEQESWAQKLSAPLLAGALGVPMFFVISGFCIHLPAARLLGGDRGVNVNYKAYVKRRFWRLYPTHLLAILGSIGIVILCHRILVWGGKGPIAPIPLSALLAHFAMLQAQLPKTAGYYFYYNPNLWSLETEVQLYVAYLVLLPMSRRWGWRTMLPVLAVVSIGYRLAVANLCDSFEATVAAQTFFVGHLYGWCLGAYLVEEFFNPSAESSQRAYRTLATNMSLLVFLALLLPYNAYHLEFARELLFATGFAVLLWWAVHRERSNSLWITNAICRRLFDWFVYVGERSYSIYLWHAPVVRLVVVLAVVFAPWIGRNYLLAWLTALVAGIVAYYVGILAFHLVERHFLANRSGAVVSPALVLSIASPPAEAEESKRAAA